MSNSEEKIAQWIMSLTTAQALDEWRKAKENLTTVTLFELALRERCVADIFPTQHANIKSHEGTATYDFPNNWQAKAVFGLSYKLPEFEKVKETMTAIRNLGTVEAADAFRNLIKYNPELSISAYRKVSGDVKKHIDNIVTTKPKRVTFELIAPKG